MSSGFDAHLLGVVGLGQRAEHLLRRLAGGEVGQHVGIEVLHVVDPARGAAGEHGQGHLLACRPSAFLRRVSSSVPSSMMVRSAVKFVSKTSSKPQPAQGRRPSCRSPGCRARSRTPRPGRPRIAGAVWTTTCLSGSSSAAHTRSMALFSVMAPTGQTAAHWPHWTHTTSARSPPKAGPMTVAKPRFCGNSAPTPWIWLQTVTQRRHMMHLPVSRMSAGVESSMTCRALLALVGDGVDVPDLWRCSAARSRRCGRRFGSRRRARRAATRTTARRASADPRRVGLDHHAFGRRLGARRHQRAGALHFDQAQAAGPDGLHALQVAEGGDVRACLPAGVQQRWCPRALRLCCRRW